MVVLVPAKIKHVQIFGNTDGSIRPTQILGGKEPFSIKWHSSDSSTPIDDNNPGEHLNLGAGTYRITVVDFNGIISYLDYRITQPERMVITPGEITPFVREKKNLANIGETKVSGGIPPYSVKWQSQKPHNKTIEMDTSLAAKMGVEADRYIIMVTDSVGATTEHMYVVSEHRRVYKNSNGFSPKRR